MSVRPQRREEFELQGRGYGGVVDIESRAYDRRDQGRATPRSPDVSVFGLSIEQGYGRGIRLGLPLEDICCDRYAASIVRGIVRHSARREHAGVVVLDPFAGTANVLVHAARDPNLPVVAAIGYESSEFIYTLTKNNLEVLGGTNVTLRDGHYAVRLRRDVAAHAGRGYLFVLHIPRASAARPRPPLAEVLSVALACLEGEHAVFVVQSDEAGAECGTETGMESGTESWLDPFAERIERCGDVRSGSWVEASLYVSCPPVDERTSALSPAEFRAGFDEFLRRTPQSEHHLRWLHAHLDWTKIDRVLSVGAGAGAVELALADSHPGLEMVCIEPNEGFAESIQARARVDAEFSVVCTRFEDFELEELDGAGPFDLILMSHSLYYMEDQAEQLSKAVGLLSARGELLIVHIHPECNLRRFQRRFGVYGDYLYTSADVKNDLADEGLAWTEDLIEVPTDIRAYPDSVSHFLMERRCSSDELDAVRAYFETGFDEVWSNVCSILRVRAEPSVPRLDPEEFATCFAVFEERSTEYEGMRQFLSRELEGRRSLLSIGCGDGTLDLPCMRAAPALRRYTGVDPNPAELERFRVALARESLRDDLACDLVSTELSGLGETSSVELILISHVLYYVDDRVGFLEDALARLAPGGTCIIFHQTNIGINRIQKRFQSYNHRICSHEVQSILDQLGVRYRTELLDATIDVADIPDEMIHFFLERKCSARELEDVRAYFEAEIGDRLYHPVCAFVIESAGASDRAAPEEVRERRDDALVEQRALQPRDVEVAGIELWEGHNVFSPTVGLTSAMMATALMEHEMFRGAESFIDVGTGTGLLAVAAAKAGARQVIALDIHVPAVACALYNVQHHELGDVVDVRQSDLLGALGEPSRRFAAGAWNQPFYRAQDGLMGLDQDVGALNYRFLAEVAPAWFRPGAPILMAYSTIAGPEGGDNDPRPLAAALGYEVVPLGTTVDDGPGPNRHRHQIFALRVPSSVRTAVDGPRGPASGSAEPGRTETLPPSLYRVNPLDHAELMRNWFAVGSVFDFSGERGCREQRFGARSLVLTRDDNGQHHALLNLCPHRGSCILAPGARHPRRGRLTCPYHRWSFELSGERATAPQLDTLDPTLPTGLDRVATLEPTALFLFARFDDGAGSRVGASSPFADYDAQLRDLGLSPDAFELVNERSYSIAANWLAIMENGLDSYHIPGTHPKSLSPYLDESDTSLHLESTSRRWIRGYYSYADEGGVRHRSAFLGTLNSFVYFIGDDYLTASTVIPIDANNSIFRQCYIARRGAPRDVVEATWRALDQTMDEDIELLTTYIQPGIQMRRNPARYHEPDPEPLIEYHRLVARALETY